VTERARGAVRVFSDDKFSTEFSTEATDAGRWP
jgi:hypothetical protein